MLRNEQPGICKAPGLVGEVARELRNASAAALRPILKENDDEPGRRD
jgi:hypothetical protein